MTITKFLDSPTRRAAITAQINQARLLAGRADDEPRIVNRKCLTGVSLGNKEIRIAAWYQVAIDIGIDLFELAKNTPDDA